IVLREIFLARSGAPRDRTDPIGWAPAEQPSDVGSEAQQRVMDEAERNRAAFFLARNVVRFVIALIRTRAPPPDPHREGQSRERHAADDYGGNDAGRAGKRTK